MTASKERPVWPWAACTRRSFIAVLLSKYAVSRSDAISRQSSMGTMTAVGLAVLAGDDLNLRIRHDLSVLPREKDAL